MASAENVGCRCGAVTIPAEDFMAMDQAARAAFSAQVRACETCFAAHHRAPAASAEQDG